MEHDPAKSSPAAVRDATLIALIAFAFGALGVIAGLMGGEPISQDSPWHVLAVMCGCAVCVLFAWAAHTARAAIWAEAVDGWAKTKDFINQRRCWSPLRCALHLLAAATIVGIVHVSVLAALKRTIGGIWTGMGCPVVLDAGANGAIRNNGGNLPCTSIQIQSPAEFEADLASVKSGSSLVDWHVAEAMTQACDDGARQLAAQGWPVERIRAEVEACRLACEALPKPGTETTQADQKALDDFLAAVGWIGQMKIGPKRSATVKVEGQRGWLRFNNGLGMLLDAQRGFVISAWPPRHSAATSRRSPVSDLVAWTFMALTLLAPFFYLRFKAPPAVCPP